MRTASVLGRAFALLREMRGLTPSALARRAGVHPGAVQEIEGGSRPRPATRARLLFALRASPSVLELARELLSLLLRPGGAGAAGELRAARRWRGGDVSVRELALRAAGPLLAVADRLPPPEAPAEARRRAEALFERLRRRPPEVRSALVEASRAFRGWALCERLCDESEQAAAHSAAEALEWAELALTASRRAPDAPGWRPILEARAWAHRGNARRVAGELTGADADFARAAELRRQSHEPTPLDDARPLDLEASLRRDQRHLREAHALLDRAEALARDDRARARVLLKRAKTLEEERKYEEAVACLLGARSVAESSGDERLSWALYTNLTDYLQQLGRHEQSAALLPEIRSVAARLGNDLDRVRLLWIEGRIFAGTGRPEEAIAMLRTVRRAFLDRAIAYDAALVTLELAVVLLELGRDTGEVLALADEAAGVCKAQGVARETLAAIEVFLEAAKREAVTLDLARQILEEVRRVGR